MTEARHGPRRLLTAAASPTIALLLDGGLGGPRPSLPTPLAPYCCPCHPKGAGPLRLPSGLLAAALEVVPSGGETTALALPTSQPPSPQLHSSRCGCRPRWRGGTGPWPCPASSRTQRRSVGAPLPLQSSLHSHMASLWWGSRVSTHPLCLGSLPLMFGLFSHPSCSSMFPGICLPRAGAPWGSASLGAPTTPATRWCRGAGVHLQGRAGPVGVLGCRVAQPPAHGAQPSPQVLPGAWLHAVACGSGTASWQ